MGTQNPPIFEIEGVLLITSRMVFRNIKSVKIVPLVIYLRTFINFKTELSKDLDELSQYLS
jgi:hypothetical protein